VYLSPRAERATQPPEDASAEWITSHASYVYLGAGAPLKALARDLNGILVYGPMTETYEVYLAGSRMKVIAACGISGFTDVWVPEGFQQQIDSTKAAVAKALAGP
jgi:hypothetical protein